MRTRRRIALLLCSAAALGVGLIAFPGSAAATPPVVPSCTFPATAGSDSCATLRTTANTAPIGSTLEPIKLGVRVRSQFDPASVMPPFWKRTSSSLYGSGAAELRLR